MPARLLTSRMPRYRYITKVPDFELARLIPGRKEILNEGDVFEAELEISASIIERLEDENEADEKDAATE